MPDRLFFLLAAAICAGFVVIALEPFADRAPSGPVSGGGRNVEDITGRGDELFRFQAGQSTGLAIEAPGGGEDRFVRITRLPDEAYEDPRSGPHLVLAEDVEFAFESRPIEVTVEARSVGDFPADQFQVNYMARAGDESGWKSFSLTREFAPYTLTYTTPTRGELLGYDYLGVRPVAAGSRRTVEIRSIRLRTAGPKVRIEPAPDGAIP